MCLLPLTCIYVHFKVYVYTRTGKNIYNCTCVDMCILIEDLVSQLSCLKGVYRPNITGVDTHERGVERVGEITDMKMDWRCDIKVLWRGWVTPLPVHCMVRLTNEIT